jgi:CRP/FNR family cyclic AMP-dependent transcriptional regulator
VAPLGFDVTTVAVVERLDPARTIGIDMLVDDASDPAARADDQPRHAQPTCVIAAHALMTRDGKAVSVIRDSGGFVTQRVVATIVNIAADMCQQAICSPGDLETAVKLGLGYPAGTAGDGRSVRPDQRAGGAVQHADGLRRPALPPQPVAAPAWCHRPEPVARGGLRPDFGADVTQRARIASHNPLPHCLEVATTATMQEPAVTKRQPMDEPILTIEEREAINSGRWFSSLSPSLRHDILRCAYVKRYPNGTLICARGDPPEEWLACAKGAIRVSSTSISGKQVTLTYVEPGIWFGDVSIFDGDRRTHDAYAHGECTLLCVSKADLMKILSQHTELYEAMLRLHARRIRQLYGLVEDLNTLPLRARLAKQLLHLVRSYGVADQSNTMDMRISLHLAQEELANCLAPLASA